MQGVGDVPGRQFLDAVDRQRGSEAARYAITIALSASMSSGRSSGSVPMPAIYEARIVGIVFNRHTTPPTRRSSIRDYPASSGAQVFTGRRLLDWTNRGARRASAEALVRNNVAADGRINTVSVSRDKM